jgi:HEAT repeat
MMNRSMIEDLFAHGSDDEICETLVDIALSEPDDGAWVQDKCLEMSRHPSWPVRAIAATCLGHLARIHGTLDLTKALPRLRDLQSDPRTAGHAENALADIARFIAKRPS